MVGIINANRNAETKVAHRVIYHLTSYKANYFLYGVSRLQNFYRYNNKISYFFIFLSFLVQKMQN